MASKSGYCLNIRLDAGTTGGVQARNNKNLGATIEFDDRPPQNGLTTARIITATSTSTGISLNQR